MNQFFVHASINGVDTRVVVIEPKQWDIPEFEIMISNDLIEDTIPIKLEGGLWKVGDSKKRFLLNTETDNNKLPASELEPLELEAIGLEIAKCWRERLSASLEVFEELF